MGKGCHSFLKILPVAVVSGFTLQLPEAMFAPAPVLVNPH